MRNLALISVLLLAGCATPYQSKGLRGGYEEVALGANRHLVTFSGNGFTRKPTIQAFAIQRAKEICAEQNLEAVILEINGESQSTQTPGSTSCIGQSYGNNVAVNCNHNEGRTINKHQAQVTVQCNPIGAK